MAYSAPPTFVDGNVLMAADLNILADNQNYLAGIDAGVQPGFRHVTLSGDTSQYYHVVYSSARPWFYGRMNLADNGSTVRLYYDSVARHTWSTANPAGEVVTDVYDMSGLGIADGAWIELRLRGVGGGTAVIEYWALMSEDIS